MNRIEFNQLTQTARAADLVNYFSKSGYTLEKFGDEYYVKEYPSLCIKAKTNWWYSHYEGTGRRNSIDCLVKICDRSFNQAVYELTGKDISSTRSDDYPKSIAPDYTSPPKSAYPKKELVMPEHNENMRRVFAYFCQERKIPAAIVEELAHAKLLYQSQERIATTINGIPQTAKPSNAVFVHRDNKGYAIGGEIQGVNSYKRYKGIVAGTGDSVFSFTPYPAKDGETETAYLFESAIDLMSFYAFCKVEKMQGVTLISMAGLKSSVPKQLEAQGVKIYSCVDNDDVGRRFERENNFKRCTDMLERADVKDWNELLVRKIEYPESVKDFVPDIEKVKTVGRGKSR